MQKSIFVNLAVADVARATAFYEAIGFTRNAMFSNEQASAMVWSDTISVMLLDRAFFATFLPEGRAIADSATTTETLLCLSFDSREAVDAVVQAAADAGGTADVRPAQDMGFMYSRAFADPDGHVFEPMFMDMAAAADAMGAAPAAA
ncbi:VOC family protein [Sphingomonas baiyangensis]|uniref:Lactoylglutathione lyase n=1 Tax=Sphingomonas baiyangensis TaxID=2572576 RepID=A0A4U1LA54_9SPHN|nr:VOC family protein [Sphingomonas baiyangensis]TKD53300.1 lactoylglutathione lyase [Sphingomonas baiyangensis]